MPRAAWPRILPFATYMGFVVLADLLARAGVAPAQLLWLYPVKIAAVLAVLFACRRHYVELAWRRLPMAHWLLAVGAGVLVLVLWLRLDAPWMVLGQSAGYVPLTQGRLDWTLALLRVAGAALVVPLMEELFWRSFLMRWLSAADFLHVSPRAVTRYAFVVTALLFGIEHPQWLAGVVAGVVYGALYRHSANLWSAVLAHAVTNALLGCWIIATANWTYW